LPVFEGVADALAHAETDVPHQPRRAVVLLVDDEDVVRRATADMIEEIGHEVVHAKSGNAALKLLAERPEIEVLITDYLMPGMRGIELLNRALELKPEIKGLLITGYARIIGNQPDIARLPKPFRASDIAREIAKLLSDGQVVDLPVRARQN
jgi:CheY-like chemotaxis protein